MIQEDSNESPKPCLVSFDRLPIRRHETKGQSVAGTNSLETIPAVAGHEQELTAAIKTRLAAFSPKTDNMGNVWVTLGAGTPNRLIATSIDEPGYVVSEITEAMATSVFNACRKLHQILFTTAWSLLSPSGSSQPTASESPGVFAGLSVHLQSGRVNGPKMNHVEELYVDIGARDAAEVHSSRRRSLDPVVVSQREMQVGSTERSRTGSRRPVWHNVLLNLLAGVDPVKVKVR